MSNDQGIQGGSENIAPRGKGIDVNADILQPINGGGFNRGATPIYDFSQEWVARVQPTAKGLNEAYVGADFATAQRTYQLRAGIKNGVGGGSTVSGRPAAFWGLHGKTEVPRSDEWRYIPVVGAAMLARGDKPALQVGRASDTSQENLQTNFTLSHGRLFEGIVPYPSQIVAGATVGFALPGFAVSAIVNGFNVADFFFRDPAGNLFGVGFGAAVGENVRFPLPPEAISLIVTAGGPAASFYYVTVYTLE